VATDPCKIGVKSPILFGSTLGTQHRFGGGWGRDCSDSPKNEATARAYSFRKIFQD